MKSIQETSSAAALDTSIQATAAPAIAPTAATISDDLMKYDIMLKEF